LKQRENNGGQGAGGGDPFDVFRRAFGFGGQGGGGQGQRRGQNMLAEIEVDLKSMYEGDSIKVRRVFSSAFSFFLLSFGSEIADPPFLEIKSSRSHVKQFVNNVMVSEFLFPSLSRMTMIDCESIFFSLGSGARSEKDIVECPICEGRGIRLVRHQLGPGIFQQVQMHCDR